MQQEGSSEKIAIVGGGIAGLFRAYILAREGKEVFLFEESNRLDGRIRTIRLDKNCHQLKGEELTEEKLEFFAEFGPMQIELDQQLLLKALLTHLEINETPPTRKEANLKGKAYLEDFASYSSITSSHDPKLRPET